MVPVAVLVDPVVEPWLGDQVEDLVVHLAQDPLLQVKPLLEVQAALVRRLPVPEVHLPARAVPTCVPLVK